jgi:hypothetical protein
MPHAVVLFSYALFGFALCCDCIFLPGLANAEDQPSRQSAEAVLGSDGIQRATILLDSYSYAPGHLVVQSGKPVELTLNSQTWVSTLMRLCGGAGPKWCDLPLPSQASIHFIVTKNYRSSPAIAIRAWKARWK